MKKIKLIIAIVLLTVVAHGQSYVPTYADIQQFFKTKTYVVLEKNPISSYNFKIQEAVKQNWTITEFEIISLDKFEELRTDPNNSFLIMTQVVFQNDKTKAKYNFLQVLLGKNVKNFEEMPDIASVPLSYTQVDADYWVYKLETLVRFLQKHLNLMNENPELIKKNVFEHYNSNIGDIRSKTLYVVKDELGPDVNTEAKIRDVYPYNVQIVDRETIEEIIKNKDKDAVFLHKVGPYGTRLSARCYKIIIGASDANFYYFDYHWIKKPKKPDGILEEDFKKMARKK